MTARIHSLLIVEDDPALRSYLASALGDLKYVVQQAHDRATALACLTSASPPGLILLDLGLPPAPSTMAEGLAVLDECLRLTPSTKVIVLTGQDERAAALEAVRRGAFDFLVKPASVATITQALRRAELFAGEEARMAEAGEARVQFTARLDEGPKEVAAAAEEQLLRRVLAETDYNIAETGRRLGMAREHVYYYLNKYGIRRPE
ncbi:MAG: Fis family two component transcriptional regulator [Rhodocyclaceae bacterium]|nr:MAG: Fis family two component transcriptional regulator [Rhodocyclaceae bacterium]TNC98013.1 MAG: Fis family two component transcriptional regulator [Rhodocyclaceae bacterium]